MRTLASLFGVALLVVGFSAGSELKAQDISLTTEIPSQEVPIEFGNEPEKEITVRVKSAKDKWSFIRFTKIPEKTSIRVNADVPPYFRGEEIRANAWYAFKEELGLLLKVNASAGQQARAEGRRQLSFLYEFGNANGMGNEWLKNAGIKDVVKYVETENIRNQGNIVAQNQHKFSLEWKSSVVAPPANGDLLQWLLIVVGGVGLLSVVVILLLKLRQRNKAVTEAREVRQKALSRRLEEVADDPQMKTEDLPPAPPAPPAASAHSAAPAPPAYTTPPVPPPPSKEIFQEHEIEKPMREPDQPVAGVKEKMAELRADLTALQTRVNTLARSEEVDSLKRQVEADLKKNVDTILQELTDYTKDIKRSQQDSKELVEKQIANHEQQVAQDIVRLNKRFDEWEYRDELYAGIVGIVIGKSVESLTPENFDGFVREVQENLNRLVREEVPSSEELKELEEEAVGVSDAFQSTAQKMCALKPEMESKLRPYIDHANQVASELKQFSSQLKCRQLNFNVRVSAHTGARDSFLAELGAAIKRELDKLRDPQTFWKHELERLATSHVIAAVDIYDKEAARVTSLDGEVEKSLKTLFAQTRLSPIRPQPGEPFRPADQNMIQMVAGPASSSQKIARVFSRGFSYTDRNGHERLIRKAGVEIYR